MYEMASASGVDLLALEISLLADVVVVSEILACAENRALLLEGEEDQKVKSKTVGI